MFEPYYITVTEAESKNKKLMEALKKYKNYEIVIMKPLPTTGCPITRDEDLPKNRHERRKALTNNNSTSDKGGE